MPRIRVLIADDHVILAQGLRHLLSKSFDVVGTVTDGHALVQAAKDLTPDVILTDLSMPVLNGLDALRSLKTSGVRAKVIVLTMHRELAAVAGAFRAGASGYLVKESAGEELFDAIQQVYDGQRYLTPLVGYSLSSILVMDVDDAEPVASPLTVRQREVLRLLTLGRTMKEVAGELGISVRTAETHKYSMMEALGIRTTAELIQYALRSDGSLAGKLLPS